MKTFIGWTNIYCVDRTKLSKKLAGLATTNIYKTKEYAIKAILKPNIGYRYVDTIEITWIDKEIKD